LALGGGLQGLDHGPRLRRRPCAAPHGRAGRHGERAVVLRPARARGTGRRDVSGRARAVLAVVVAAGAPALLAGGAAGVLAAAPPVPPEPVPAPAAPSFELVDARVS